MSNTAGVLLCEGDITEDGNTRGGPKSESGHDECWPEGQSPVKHRGVAGGRAAGQCCRPEPSRPR